MFNFPQQKKKNIIYTYMSDDAGGFFYSWKAFYLYLSHRSFLFSSILGVRKLCDIAYTKQLPRKLLYYHVLPMVKPNRLSQCVTE